eukprot:SAG11_NODE_36026_length_263_cov_3.176829_1_plen_27_part_01
MQNKNCGNILCFLYSTDLYDKSVHVPV